MDTAPRKLVPRAFGLPAILCLVAACGGGGGDGTNWPGGSQTASGTVMLEWDTPVGANILGYKVYYGTASLTYNQPFGQGVDVSLVNSYSVAGLTSGTTYYFAVTGYDASNSESAYSNEIFKLIPD